MGKRGDAQHVVVASDGDIFDQKQATEEFTKLMKQRPNLTVSFVIAHKREFPSTFHKFVESLGEFKDRITLNTCKPELLAEAVLASANCEPWQPEITQIREDIGKLRAHFLQALDQLDDMEARLDGREPQRRSKPQDQRYTIKR